MRRPNRIFTAAAISLLITLLTLSLSFFSFAEENATLSFAPDPMTEGVPGYTAGTVTVTKGTKSLKSGWYALCFADDKGTLDGYEAIARVPIASGDTTEIPLPYGMYLPPKATRLVLFEGATKGIAIGKIDKAVASFDLPQSTLDLGKAEFTFASVSDVHLNYDDHGYGASPKWTAALNFFAEKKMDIVVMTGDMTESGGKTDYERYKKAVEASSYPANQIYEAKGNHDSPENTLFLKYTVDENTDQVHPYPGSPYFHLLKKGEEGQRDNLFIFMAQELSATGNTASEENFSETQLDWLEDLLVRYAGKNTNIFIIEHSLMRNFGPGDRINGAYGGPILLEERFDGHMRFKELLTEYKEAILMSGHTHLSLYELLNFSDERGSAARMIHNSSVSQPRSYTASGTISYNSEGATTATKGSEGYLVYVYSDHILYVGYNLTTGKIIPAACYLMKAYDEDRSEVSDISLKTAPKKTEYAVGEWFNGEGMEIEATLKDGSKKIVSGWGVSKVGALTEDDTFVEIYYGSLEKTVKVEISVGKKSEGGLPFRGEGSLEKPYLIEDAEDFMALTDLFNASKSSSAMFGKGLHFRQTADIDMTDYQGYKGTPANGDDKRYFAGNYDGGGYTLTVNIKSTGQTSVFPYVYGAIYNVVMRGSIESNTSAQPFRTLQVGGVLANSDISLKLVSSAGNCICYTNYTTVYNVYVHGQGDDIFKTVNASGSVLKVYSDCKKDSGSALTDSHTTAVTDVAQVATVMVNKTTADDVAGIDALTEALGGFSNGVLAAIEAKDGELVFSHPAGYSPDGGDGDDGKEESPLTLRPLTWGLVKRSYGDKEGSLLLLKVASHSGDHVGAPLFRDGLLYTLTVNGKSAKVEPAEIVGRLAIGFNLADYDAFDALSSGKNAEIGLKVEQADGTLLFEGSTTVSSGKTDYIATPDLTAKEPEPEPEPSPSPSDEESLPASGEPSAPASEEQDSSAPASGEDKDDEKQDKDSSFSPLFLIPIGVAVVIAVGVAVFAVMKKKKA